MALIRIQESSEQAGSFYAKVSFSQEPAFDVTIRDPFSKAEEECLEWYFEEHLKFPFTNQVKAQEAAASISMYGEMLFEQVFVANPRILSTYKTAVQAGLDKIQIEVSGQPPFHALHWEALKDPASPHPLALQVTILRQNLSQQAVYTERHPSPTINLLIVTARPRGRRDMGYRTVSGPLVEVLRQTEVPVQVEILRPGTYKELENHLRETASKRGVGHYHVIHFDVHGSLLTDQEFRIMNRSMRTQRPGRRDIRPYEGLKAFLALEGEQDGMADLVEAEELAALLREHQIPIAILNACQSGKQVGERETSLGSYLMQAGIQMVVAMGYTVTVSATELLMRTLYQHLFAKDDLAVGMRHGRTALYNHKSRRAYFNQMIELEDWLLPVVYQNQQPTLQVRAFTPEESAASNRRAVTHCASPQPRYGFVGRDLDILQLEKRLLMKRNVVLVRGMGGAGKTTLLHYLGWWWQTTGFVEHVFYFGYDERPWTLQQILTNMARQLLDEEQYRKDFQSLDLEAQQTYLVQRLHTEKHLLILDNLESITGAPLAIQHTLPKGEQEALRAFLADLVGGRTLVLLGSRSDEKWLAGETFGNNEYELVGLDPEAASTLAERILERVDAMKYRQEENLKKLLTLLDGFPLALEVVLANLAYQTPAEVLAALQAGDITLVDKSNSEGKTESILRCIDYSHSNLSPDAQQMLLCLAPFTSVFDIFMLGDYISHLRQQPVLASLPFERLPEVLGEAKNWGLLRPEVGSSFCVHLQPVLPYFLRTRLQRPELAETRRAIETAFLADYTQRTEVFYNLLVADDPRKRDRGRIQVHLEYENLLNALNLALREQTSIYYLYLALSEYLILVQDPQHGLELGLAVLSHLETYPPDDLQGPTGVELVEVISDIASWQLSLKQYAEAEALYQKALVLQSALKSLTPEQINWGCASIYMELGKVKLEQRQWAQAKQHYQLALQVYTESHDPYREGGVYHQLGRVEEEQHHWAEAEQYFQRALRAFAESKSNDRSDVAQTYFMLGFVAQEQRHWARAEVYYQRALQIFIEYNDHSGQAKCYNNLGIIALRQQKYSQAERYYQLALQFKIESNDRYGQASTYQSLGLVALGQQHWAQAEQYYLQALHIFLESKNRYGQAIIYQHLGMLMDEQRQWIQAEKYYQQALHIFLESNDRYEQAVIHGQLGMIALKQHQLEQAFEYLLQALKIYVEYEDKYRISFALHALAILWQMSSDMNVAATIAPILGASFEETEMLLRRIWGNGVEEVGGS